MNTNGVGLLAAGVLAATLLSLGSNAGSQGALHCLRGGRTNDMRVCLSCHDGSLAFNLTLAMPKVAGTTPCTEHPVPVDYAGAYARHPTEFVPPGLLDPQVQLINGEVQCLSCHTTNAKGDWVPLRPLGTRPLCLSCHRK